MNLIEQLGGYEKAKAFINATSYTVDELLMMQRSGLRSKHVEEALLQYRRKHNIFEVGDLVVCLFGQDSTFLTKDEIYTVKEVCYGGTHVTLKLQENYDGGDSSYSVNRFNHATDEEIEANKRLEVG